MFTEDWLKAAIEKDNAETQRRLALIQLDELKSFEMQLRLDRLCDEHRQVLDLWNGGKPRAEIANTLTIAPATVTNIISLLRKRLGSEQVRAARPKLIKKRRP